MIIRSFMDLIVLKDFRKVTISDILEEAGISKGTFYKHFQDKYDLLLQAYESFFSDFQKKVLLSDGFACSDEFVSFFNANRFYYVGLMNINDNILSIRDSFKESLKEFYQNQYFKDEIEADFYANQVIWMMDCLSNLNRMIQKEDVSSFLLTGQKISFRLSKAF